VLSNNTLVVSEDLKDLPEKGEAIYVRKDGSKLVFIDGNFKKDMPAINRDETVTVP
jgi:hypothetical protein